MEWGGCDVFQLEPMDVEEFKLEKNIKSEKVRFCIRMATLYVYNIRGCDST